jgi:hypothetical protein
MHENKCLGAVGYRFSARKINNAALIYKLA